MKPRPATGPSSPVWVESMGGPLGASSKAESIAAAQVVLADPRTAWEDCGVWTTDGPAVLMDPVTAGADLGTEYPGTGRLPEQAPVMIPAGSRRVRAVHAWSDENTSVGVIRLLGD
ncbi:Imm21 family immunity protein [Actinoplanes sp. G11-F43]|uniref:Imm21 family immunity protein n=1 Tax=Actinoplanes sp. G11-F43 TaxID=3424130 RepID=UPI003D35439B